MSSTEILREFILRTNKKGYVLTKEDKQFIELCNMIYSDDRSK